MTGAAGRVGSALRAPLRDAADHLILVDRAPLKVEAPNEQTRQTQLTSVEDAIEVIGGATAVVHLAGVSDEAPFPDLVEGNILGTHHILEAARRTGVRRVVLASSNRLTGHYPTSQRLTADMPPRPDGLYGVSKVAVEALARLYVDKFGLDVVCLRIGSFEHEPTEARHLATWLSPRDLAGFVQAAITVPDPGFIAAYAVSGNTRGFWEISPALGYTPQDDAETYADRIPGAADYTPGDEPQGGYFASQEFTVERARLG